MYAQPFARLIAPARAYPQIWRLLVGVFLLVVVYLFFAGFIVGTVSLIVGLDGALRWLERMAEASTPTATLLLLATFSGMALGPILAARLLHKRRAATLFGPTNTALSHFVFTAAIVSGLYAISLGWWFTRYDAVPNLDLALWLNFLPLAVIGLLLQTGAEELVFRGYLQQQLAARFKSPVIWMIFPSIAFGMLHFDPTTAGSNVWLIVGSATLFGLIAADLTALSGSLGAAWGFHFANNVAAVLVLATDGTLPGLALYLTPYSIDDANALGGLIMTDLVFMVVAWGLCRLAVRR